MSSLRPLLRSQLGPTRRQPRRQSPPRAGCWRRGRAGALLVILAMLCFGLGQSVPAGQAATVPAFAATALDGSPRSLDDVRGDVVLLNAWATWCTPCRTEMPFLQSLADEFGPAGLRVVGVSIDRAGSEERIAEFLPTVGVTFDIWRDPANTFARTFRTTGVPATLLISRDGQLLATWMGPLTEDGPDRQVIADAVAGTLVTPTSAAAPLAATLTLPLAFGAGVLSFLSPCFLPLVPTYAAIFTGMGLRELSNQSAAGRARSRRAMLLPGVAFIVGFSLVFVLLGASATIIGGFLLDYRDWVMRLGGVLLAGLGLHLLGVFRLPFLERSAQVAVAPRRVSPVGAFAIGLAFGAGWTPCIGPVLGSILVLAAATASVGQGMLLLAVYAAGLAIPFLGATLLLDQFLRRSRARAAWFPWLQRASGILVLVVAVLLFTGALTQLATYLTPV